MECEFYGGSVFKGVLAMTLSPAIKQSASIRPPTPGQIAWFAVQVRAQREKDVAERLSGAGYERFLPLYKCKKQWSDRIKEVEAPLFPGYLFCRFNPQVRLPILKTPGVIQIVGSNGGPTPMDEVEIDAVRTLVASGVPNQPWPFLEVGDRVRVESGPLHGMEGILIAFKGNHRLLISITHLQRSVAADIDVACVSLQSSVRSRDKKGTHSELGQVLIQA